MPLLTFINEMEKPLFLNYIIGLGGRDITGGDFREIVEKSRKAMETGEYETPTWINVDKEAVRED